MPGAGRLGKSFNRVWIAYAISNAGDGVTFAAAPLLAASLTRDPVQVGAVGFALTLPWVLLAPVTGVIADRVSRPPLLATVDTVRAAVVATVGVTALTGTLTLPLLYALAFLLGAGECLFDITAEALVPNLVDDDQLEGANSRLTTVESIGNEFAGPPAGGLLFSLSAGVPFLVDAVSFLASAALLRGVREPPSAAVEAGDPPAAPQRLYAAFREGFLWTLRNPAARVTVLLPAAGNFAAGAALLGVLVLYAQDVLGLGAVGFGVLLTAGGVGGIVGVLAAPALGRAAPPHRSLAAMLAVAAAALVGMAVAPNAWWGGTALAVLSGGIGATTVINMSLRQALVPDRLRGRVASIAGWLGTAGYALGALLGGVIAEALGLRGVYFICAAVVAALVPLVLANVRDPRRTGPVEGSPVS